MFFHSFNSYFQEARHCPTHTADKLDKTLGALFSFHFFLGRTERQYANKSTMPLMAVNAVDKNKSGLEVLGVERQERCWFNQDGQEGLEGRRGARHEDIRVRTF